MKKIISILMITLMLLSVSVCAAGVTLEADYKYDAVTNSFTVFGSTNDTKYGDSVTAEMFLDGTLIDTATARTVKGDSKMIFETAPILVDASIPSGKIQFKVHSSYADNTVTTSEFDYCGLDKLFPILQELATKMKAGDFDGYLSVVDTNKVTLYVDIDSVKSLSGDAKTLMKEYNKTVTLDLPDNISTTENQDKVMEQLMVFRTEFEKMALVGKFEDLASASDFTTWYNTYGRFLEMDKYENGKYFLDNYKAEEFFGILSKKESAFDNLADIKERITEAGALTKVATSNATAVKGIFEEFDIKVSGRLTAMEKSEIYGKLAGEKFADFKALADKFDEYAKDIDDDDEGGSTRPGGILGGNSVAIGSPSTNAPSTTAPSTVIFADMESALWANDAVNYLFQKGIVNGKDANTFAPLANVTRAEFTKMIVLAYCNLETATEQVFTDVTPDAWYYDYVYTAQKYNLVKGSNGNFRPNDFITREDMAVIIARVLGVAQSDVETAFADNGDISDYAKSSVLTLSQKGIINGMGDNMFKPKNLATRAQAAQVIYKLLLTK